ncbi:hypothetical protein SAMN05216548_10177 [Faunimonas pinastri]|uniref:Uncharacterized protein n=1 Tax=Faunimonas pinastri TaxID=1855383 RepID=A0A1H8Z8U8_9HYPH|nr:hypothetical protein [Faunimonas pinastri]SEP60860.1 hypothetical protein SAMN05216548_10177 [Faunimonas pinastri]
MPDYVSILRRSFAALPEPNAASRAAIYERARSALSRQLHSVDPPLTEDEIALQEQQLESAISELEDEYAAFPEYEPEYEDEPHEASSGHDHREGDHDDGHGGHGHYDEQHGADYQGADYREDEHHPESDPEAPSPVARGREKNPAEPGAARFQMEPRSTERRNNGPTAKQLRAPTRSRTPAIAIAGVVLAVVIVGGVAYAKRDALGSMFGGGSGHPTQTASNDAAPDRSAQNSAQSSAQPPAPVEKNTERLPSDSGPTAAATAPAGTDADTPPNGAAVPAAPDAAANPDNVNPPANAPAAGESLVAQRAIYYQQGLNGAPGKANQGAIAWSQIQSKDGQPAIQGVVTLPDQNVTVTLTITRNTDQGLPASHMVEIAFSGSGQLASSGVDKVPALVLKPSEQARGTPLAGVPMTVTDRLFWVALSDQQDNITRNLSALRTASWFDMPILFKDGTRALITFEKGIPGDKIFQNVIDSWTKS